MTFSCHDTPPPSDSAPFNWRALAERLVLCALALVMLAAYVAMPS